MIRIGYAAAFAAVAVAVGVVACSSSDDTTNNGNSSGGTSTSSSGANATSTSSSGTAGNTSKFQSCASSSTPASCKQSDLDTYSSCVQDKCDTEYQKCYGAGYKDGNFGGACGTYVACVQKCGCNNTSCVTACGQPDSDCSTCLQGFATCSQGCTLPACYAESTPDSGAGSTATHTCAQLTACCAKVASGALQDACNSTASSGQDAQCSAVYSAFSGQASDNGQTCDP